MVLTDFADILTHIVEMRTLVLIWEWKRFLCSYCKQINETTLVKSGNRYNSVLGKG
jgi:hypothetical protein